MDLYLWLQVTIFQSQRTNLSVKVVGSNAALTVKTYKRKLGIDILKTLDR